MAERASQVPVLDAARRVVIGKEGRRWPEVGRLQGDREFRKRPSFPGHLEHKVSPPASLEAVGEGQCL